MRRDTERVPACRRTWLATASGAASLATLVAGPAPAATCQFIGGPQFGGIEPPLAVDGTCTDHDYNEKTLVNDRTEQKTLDLTDGTKLAYTSAFPILDGPTMTIADAATGATVGHVDLAVLATAPADRASLANALKERGCTAQLAQLASAPEAAAH